MRKAYHSLILSEVRFSNSPNPYPYETPSLSDNLLSLLKEENNLILLLKIFNLNYFFIKLP
jgi:hypothetical protein